MGLSPSNLLALKTYSISELASGLQIFEFLKYDTKSFRSLDSIGRDDLFEAFTKSSKIKIKSRSQQKKKFDEAMKKLNTVLMARDGKDEITGIKWKRIDEFCNLLRLIERSDERKTRWALYRLFSKGKTSLNKKDIQIELGDLKISNLDKQLKGIIKDEYASGLDAKYDGKNLVINHDINDKLVSHYLADAIEESSRRSPGELEVEILKLLDEGSYSNQEIAKTLMVDEAMTSRAINRLRKQNKIILSSFGERGSRYFTTDCENCPFGTTKPACRKEALSYIISEFAENYGIDLSANDFEEIKDNQALLKIKRVVMVALKEKNTKMEKSISKNLSKLLGRVVEKSVEVSIPEKNDVKIPDIEMGFSSQMNKLPILYQIGLLKGAQSGVRLVDNILQNASKSIKKEDRLKIKKHALDEANKFLKAIGLENLSED